MKHDVEEDISHAGVVEMLSIKVMATPRAPRPIQQNKPAETHTALLLEHRQPAQPEKVQTNRHTATLQQHFLF